MGHGNLGTWARAEKQLGIQARRYLVSFVHVSLTSSLACLRVSEALWDLSQAIKHRSPWPGSLDIKDPSF